MIDIKNLICGYGKKTVINGFDATIESGKLTALVGTNGCGKSTLLKAVSGIIDIGSGCITVDSKNIKELGRKNLSQRVAYLPQDNTCTAFTVGQLVLQGRFPYLRYPKSYSDDDKKIVSKAIEEMGLKEHIDSPVETLSGGMKQNAFIAMALAQKTDNILMDEPTAFLDINNRLQLMERLKSLADNGKTVLAVLHDISLALDYADSIIVIDKGKSIFQGDADSVFSSGVLNKTFGVEIERVRTDDRYAYKYKQTRQ